MTINDILIKISTNHSNIESDIGKSIFSYNFSEDFEKEVISLNLILSNICNTRLKSWTLLVAMSARKNIFFSGVIELVWWKFSFASVRELLN